MRTGGENKRSIGAPRWALLSIAVLSVAAMIGCAAKRAVLVPAPNAVLAQTPNSARASADGVTMVAQAEAWNGTPADLDKKVLPLKVTIKNNSGHPLAIRFDEFSLVGPNDQNYAAIPPIKITGTQYAGLRQSDLVANQNTRLLPAAYPAPQAKGAKAGPVPAPPTRVVIVPQFDWDDYYVAPWWGYSYPGLGFWSSPWAPNWGYYDHYYPYMQELHLPTKSMLRKAIPEGVVASGGMITGFIYFEKPPTDKAQRLTLQAKLVDAKTDQTFGHIAIPFQQQPNK